jgi:ASC-1-like (ASCH) protein
MADIPTLYVKEKWYNEIISGTKKYEFRLGKDFFISLNKKMIWLSTHDNKRLVYIKSIHRYESFDSLINEPNDMISYTTSDEFLKLNHEIYSQKNINKFGVLALEIIFFK